MWGREVQGFCETLWQRYDALLVRRVLSMRAHVMS